jgi:pimeloyl-ACP methyl ester carboxylesterase
MWRAWFAPLAADGFRVMAPDLPGHGLSDKPDAEAIYTRDGLVGCVRELLAAQGVTEADVVAQSMAGTIAVALALGDGSPVRRLALVNPALFGRVRMERLFKLVSPPVIDAILPRLVRRWLVDRTHRVVYGDPSRLRPRDVDEYWAPSQFPSYARAMRRLLHAFDWERVDVGVMVRRLAPLANRMIVILGTRDRLVLDARPYVSVLQSRLPDLRVHEALGGGHAVNEERPEELVPMVRAFLAEPG